MIDLHALHRELLARHGPQGWWWPGEQPFEIALGAVLVQRSRWEQAAQALAALTDAGLREPAPLAAADEEHVRELVRPAGFPRSKPRRVQALAAWWAERAEAAAELDEAFVAELLVGAQDGVEVDVEACGDVARGGEAVARGERPCGDGGAQLCGELLEERLGRGGVDREEHTLIVVVCIQLEQAPTD